MLFMGILWLMGVFVFAVLIGNVKEIIAQATAAQDDYMFRFDQLRGVTKLHKYSNWSKINPCQALSI